MEAGELVSILFRHPRCFEDNRCSVSGPSWHGTVFVTDLLLGDGDEHNLNCLPPVDVEDVEVSVHEDVHDGLFGYGFSDRQYFKCNL